jgi:hypothetical protein
MTRFYGLPMIPTPAREDDTAGRYQEEEQPMDTYALTLQALIGQGWMTVAEIARRAGLPYSAVDHALNELVGSGKVAVSSSQRDGNDAVLVYADPESAL